MGTNGGAGRNIEAALAQALCWGVPLSILEDQREPEGSAQPLTESPASQLTTGKPSRLRGVLSWARYGN